MKGDLHSLLVLLIEVILHCCRAALEKGERLENIDAHKPKGPRVDAKS